MSDSAQSGWAGVTGLSAKRWFVLTGSRTALAGVLAAILTLVAAALVFGGVVYVGPDSTLSTALASGMIGALATIVTVTLSINQLILSRVFGTPGDLSDRLEANLEFRESIEDVAGVDASPNDPGSFLALVARSLEERAAELDRVTERATGPDDDTREDVLEFTSSLGDYAEQLDPGDETDSTFEVLELTFGTEYADHIDDARRLERGSAGALSADATDHLDAILELLKGVAIVRQFFKTLAVQQDLASLSRQLIYTGTVAIVLAFFYAQVYVGGRVASAVPVDALPLMATLAVPVLFAPLLVLVSYILRVATVTLYTVSVGSFIPPAERVDGD
jgi:hypothetical protein